MLALLFKFSASLFASYVILSFVYNGKYVFDHINSLTGPLGENIQQAISQSVDYSVNNSKKITQQLFTSATPPASTQINEGTKTDKVSTAQSATKPRKLQVFPPSKTKSKSDEAPQEDISEEETRQLDQLFHNEE